MVVKKMAKEMFPKLRMTWIDLKRLKRFYYLFLTRYSVDFL